MSALMLEQVTARLDDLPSLPAVVMELLSAIDQEDVDISVLAKKVSHDQALTAKTLRLANSSLYGLQVKVTTIAQAITFLGFQAFEYMHAYRDLNLKLSSGVFGSTFYMLTGFHGFHVFVGMLMLLFITLRLQKGHFTKDRHFGFEGAAWYWHFVDVVWLGLYVVVYWM